MNELFDSKLKLFIFTVFPVFLFLGFPNPFFICNFYLFLISVLFVFHFITIKNFDKNDFFLNNFNFIILIILFLTLYNFFFLTHGFKFSRTLMSLIYISIVFSYVNFSSKKNVIINFNFKKQLSNFIYFIYGLTFVTLLVYVANNSFFGNEEGRFVSWSHSPTTMSTYLLWLYIILLSFEPSRKIKFLLFWFLFIVVFLSGTRTSLLIFFLVYFASKDVFNNFFKKYFYTVSIGFICLFLFTEPIYNLVFEYGLNSILGRYSNEIDYSALTRLELTNKMVHVLGSSNLFELLFGHGLEYTFNFMNPVQNESRLIVLPHNDFLKLAVDQGIIFLLLFVFLIIAFFKKLKVLSIAPIFVYFSSFFHNMIYDHFNFILLLLCFSVLKLRK